MMTKPVPTGKRAIEVYEAIEQLSRDGKKEALDGLWLMLGEDTKAAIENQRGVIEKLEKIEQAMAKMSQLQINAASKLLNE